METPVNGHEEAPQGGFDEVDEPLTDSEIATIEGRKLFVGGLSWDTDDEALKAHFAQFGEVLESVVVYNKTAGISRGFGFVTYVDAESAQAALKHPVSHRVNEKTIEAKLAVQKGDQVTLSLEEKMAKQVFVGGLPPNVTSDNLKEWAEKWWGTDQVVNAIVVLNMETKLTRGFGFVNFRDPSHVEAALKGDRSQYMIDGKQVEVKRAQTQDKRRVNNRGRFGQGGGKGRKAGRGRGRQQHSENQGQFMLWQPEHHYGAGNEGGFAPPMAGMPNMGYGQGYPSYPYEQGYMQYQGWQGEYPAVDGNGAQMPPQQWMMPQQMEYPPNNNMQAFMPQEGPPQHQQQQPGMYPVLGAMQQMPMGFQGPPEAANQSMGSVQVAYAQAAGSPAYPTPVSYTHLTLPTKRIV
eukprot:TRINITY_DN802_c0_g1_i1.p1 TRINITY_DN802_c0_g1~~TRINITY_DN802_c0_g1_i1.p1  ORF type:complete len:406 (-),score=88.27 TRINITY_DN802_c0_g1_i1:96-1313(-)